MLINDFQGVPSLPEATSDEFITSQGMFSQPTARPSVMTGFVAVCKVFRILSEAFFHHRCMVSGFHTVSPDWTVSAEERLHEVLRDLPDAIQNPTINTSEASRQVFAMQRANILITAAICKFALVRSMQGLADISSISGPHCIWTRTSWHENERPLRGRSIHCSWGKSLSRID